MFALPKSYFFAAFLMMLLALPACAGDYPIVPGQRVGTIELGMSRQKVHDLLHVTRIIHVLSNGVIQEDWVSRRKSSQAAKDQGIFWKWDFVTVYFRHDQVVQVEANSARFSTSGGLSTRSSPAQWGKQFRPFHSTYQTGASHDPGGYPGTKHFMAYYDDVQRGIAWREANWGDLDPGPNPGDPPAPDALTEIVIVHAKGQRVISDPDGDARFVLTAADVHLN